MIEPKIKTKSVQKKLNEICKWLEKSNGREI